MSPTAGSPQPSASSVPGRVAIVTGASRGIGAGLVTAFRHTGYAVVATARSMPASDDDDVLAIEGDIADVETGQRVVDAAVRRFGRVDTLINDAGIYIAKPFTDYTPDEYRAITAVNLAGFFHITQPVIRQMLTQGDGHGDGHGSGHIVNVSTSLVDQPDSTRPAALVALTKGGLAAVTRSLAIEYASRGLRVNAVSLGVIMSSIGDAASYDGMAALHPLGRLGDISDVVDGVLYLEQAPFVTGEVLHIDGGQAAGH